MDVVSELCQMALETPSIIVTDERTSKDIVVAGDECYELAWCPSV